MLKIGAFGSAGVFGLPVARVIGVIVVVGLLSFLRLFWGLIRWEVQFDLRILEFGLHMFLLGAVSIVLVLVWLFRGYLF